MKKTLFLSSILSTIFAALPTNAAIDDSINPNAKLIYNIDGIYANLFGTGQRGEVITNQYIASATRFYDSTKGAQWTTTHSYTDPTTGETTTWKSDSLMCWTHAASNSIQYWQDVYGVFYKDKGNMVATGSNTPRPLPNGAYSTKTVYDVEINNPRELNIAYTFHENWDNSGGKFGNATDWYFKWDSATSTKPGGYYSEYFGNGNDSRSSFVTIYSAQAEGSFSETSPSGHSPFTDTRAGLKEVLLPAFGFEKNNDGTYTQTQEGLMPFIGIWNLSTGTGHMLSCQGFNLDANGNLISLLIADGDDAYNLTEAYLKEENGYVTLYKNSDLTQKYYTSGNYYIGEISYIDTPEVLRNMLTEYRSTEESAVWNGGASTWETQVDVVDSEIADSSTGWDVLVDGENIDSAHHGYYHGYALEGRDVEFGDHADTNNRAVTINGTVKARHIEVTAAGYQFLAGENATIATTDEASSLNIRSGASLVSEVGFDNRSLLLEHGASLELRNVGELRVTDLELQGDSTITAPSTTIYVSGTFSTLAGTSSTYSMRSVVIPEASINADLDLTDATAIVLETMVNMNGHDLFLNSDTPITLNLVPDSNTLPFFTNIGELYLDNKLLQGTVDLTSTLNFANPEDFANYSIIFSDGSLNLIVPEPNTISLSLLAFGALALRRRRH